MSPIDEWVYLDYLQKVPTQGMVFRGEEMTQEALGYMACDGQVFFGRYESLDCDGSYDRTQFPQEGTTSAQIYTPIFFAPTSFVGYAIHFATGIDLIMAWRLASSLWLVAGLLVFLMLLRLFRVPDVVQFMAGILIIGAPISYMVYSYVSTDAPALLFGSLLLYVTIRFIRGQMPGWPIALVGVLASAAKGAFVLGVVLMGIILLVEWAIRANMNSSNAREFFSNLFSRRSLVLPLWAMVTVTVVALGQIAWVKLINVLAVAPGVSQGVEIQLTIVELLRQSTAFVLGAMQTRFEFTGPLGLDGVPVPSFAAVPFTWILAAGILSAFWTLTKKSENRSLIIGAGIGVLALGPLLALMIQYSTGFYFAFPSRYAAILIPVLMVIVALQVRNKWAIGIMAGYGAALTLAHPVASFLVTAYSP